MSEVCVECEQPVETEGELVRCGCGCGAAMHVSCGVEMMDTKAGTSSYYTEGCYLREFPRPEGLDPALLDLDEEG